jgi:3-phenylpropionate/trans-cinnamate dioxygenase ferredoxin reductase subunit
MNPAAAVVIVGAGLGGLRTGEELRRAGHTGPITLIGAERYRPYDRPPLSKEVLRGERDPQATVLRAGEFFDDPRVTLGLGERAAALDPDARTITLTGGSTLSYDRAVVATGLVPRRLPHSGRSQAVHVLRSLDDALALRHAALGARRALIIGAGFIGCEVAASLRTMGIDVVLVEPCAVPLALALGDQVGGLVGRLHVTAGVDLRCGTGLVSIEEVRAGLQATLSDGTTLHVDLALSGIGSGPATGWLSGSGIAIGNGVLCDSQGRTSAPGVWALGDVAAWPDSDGTHLRAEHWTRTREQAKTVARSIMDLGHGPSRAGAPYFWSDQFGLKIQALGTTEPQLEVVVIHDDGQRFLCAYVNRGRVVGVVGCGMAGRIAKAGALLSQAPTLGPLREEMGV